MRGEVETYEIYYVNTLARSMSGGSWSSRVQM